MLLLPGCKNCIFFARDHCVAGRVAVTVHLSFGRVEQIHSPDTALSQQVPPASRIAPPDNPGQLWKLCCSCFTERQEGHWDGEKLGGLGLFTWTEGEQEW